MGGLQACVCVCVLLDLSFVFKLFDDIIKHFIFTQVCALRKQLSVLRDQRKVSNLFLLSNPLEPCI
jgi:hypothetical protein